jgi:hypothetical protein
MPFETPQHNAVTAMQKRASAQLPDFAVALDRMTR